MCVCVCVCLCVCAKGDGINSALKYFLKVCLPITKSFLPRFNQVYTEIKKKLTKPHNVTGLHLPIMIKQSI